MTSDEWMNDFCARIEVNEGVRSVCYQDSVGIPTIGVGFNLTRLDAANALADVGASLPDVLAGAPLSPEQIRKLLAYAVKPVVDQARISLQPMHFSLLSEARRCAISDLVYNMGADTWRSFYATRGLLDEAVHTAVRLNDAARAHALFGEAAAHLRATPYAAQVGNRALRNCEMIETSVYVSPTKTY